MARNTEDSPTLDRCRAIVREGESWRPCGRYVANGSGRYCPEHMAQYEPRCCEDGCDGPALKGTKFCSEHLYGTEVLYPGPCPEKGQQKGMTRMNWAFQRLQYERPDLFALTLSGDDAQSARGMYALWALLNNPDGPIPDPPQTPLLREQQGAEGSRESGSPKRRKARLGPMPQRTAPEVREIAIALANGPFGKNWTENTAENALVHSIPGDPLQTKLDGRILPWWGLAPERANLWTVLAEHGGIPAVLLLHEAVGRLLELPPGKAHVTVPLNELAQAAGFLRRRTKAEREEALLNVYKTLLLLDGFEVHGQRNGKWRDPRHR